MSIIRKWIITNPPSRRIGCLVGLPGRGIPGDLMERFCEHAALPDSQFVCFEPHWLAWYPSPRGIKDQKDAVNGLMRSTWELNEKIKVIEKQFGIPRQEMALVGFSAGAVMALHLLSSSKDPFAAVVSIGGSVLEPALINAAKGNSKTPILLRHNRDDDCFDWYERYLPMKKTLVTKGYNVHIREEETGGHTLTVEDAHIVGQFLAPILGYDEWEGFKHKDKDED